MMSLSVNSEELDDFEPGKFVYRLGMDAQELEQAQLSYEGEAVLPSKNGVRMEYVILRCIPLIGKIIRLPLEVDKNIQKAGIFY